MEVSSTRAARKISEVGGSLRDVQELAGHVSLGTTATYIEGDHDAQRKVCGSDLTPCSLPIEAACEPLMLAGSILQMLFHRVGSSVRCQSAEPRRFFQASLGPLLVRAKQVV
jgi:hypothetical protein